MQNFPVEIEIHQLTHKHKEKFDNTKSLIRSHKSKKDRQYNGQKGETMIYNILHQELRYGGICSIVVITFQSFPRSWHIAKFVTRVTRRVSPVKQELLEFIPGFYWVCVAIP
jgi:hypothetical protein